jgi:hypothetical protein
MSELDKLLQGCGPPAVPVGLAQRAVAEAVKQAQETAPAPQRRGNRRGGWKRPLWIGATGFGIAFTSAVAATVVSGGRIEIPVVQQVVEAIPVLDKATRRNEPLPQVAEAKPPKPEAAVDEPAQAVAVAPQPGEPGYRKARVMQKLAEAKVQVEARRAAGLPTPRADRIEHQAKAIVERREAAGLPTPSVEEVEAGLALRELRQMWLMRRAGRIDPSMLTDQQLARIANHLPPEKRERFLALPPNLQRQLVVQRIEQMRARRMARQGTFEPQPEQASPIEPADPANSAE